MNFTQLRNSFEFNNYLIITNEICDILLLKPTTFI